MLALVAELGGGAHPYFGTPEHTVRARSALGTGKLLCVEQKVVLTTDADEARSIAGALIGRYARTPNYRRSWRRLGFSDDEIDAGSARFVEALIAWGDAARIRERVTAHYRAGADHVCIQPLSAAGWGTPDREAIAALAPRRGDVA
jgi:probable F420-dependent oxidoreductase